MTKELFTEHYGGVKFAGNISHIGSDREGFGKG
jgi:hypothetical protein